MSWIQITDPVKERTVCEFTGILKDESGNAIDGGVVNSMSLWLYDADGDIINSKEGISIKNTNGGSIDSNGNWALTLDAIDNVLVTSQDEGEYHIAVIKWLWSGNTKDAYEVIRFHVENLEYVPPTADGAGTITGTVSNGGGAVSGAIVTVAASHRVTTADSNGAYTFADLALGSHTVQAAAAGVGVGSAIATISTDGEVVTQNLTLT